MFNNFIKEMKVPVIFIVFGALFIYMIFAIDSSSQEIETIMEIKVSDMTIGHLVGLIFLAGLLFK